MLWPLSLSQTQSNTLTEDFVIIFVVLLSESRDVLRTHAAGEFLFLVRKHLSDGKINLFFWKEERRLTLEPWFLLWRDCLAESCERVDLEEEKTCVSWTYVCEHMNKTPYQD